MKQTITNRHSFSANLRGTTRALLCLMALFLIGGGVRAWGQETITLTQENLGLTGSYTTNTTKVISDVTFQWTDLMKNNTSIQAKATTGTICNTTAFEGNIQSVQITHTNDARSTTVSYSTNGSDWTVVSTFEGSATIDLSSYNCSYFKITRGKNAAYWSSIEITYTTTGVTPTAATPTFSLTEGTYVGPQNVSISCTTEGASIRYTTDGTDPTESSTMYSDPIQISETTTLKAKAWAEGYNPSNTASAIYTITQPTATAPTLPASTIFEDEFEVTITNNESDPGSKVYYTTDGSTPTSSSSYFQGPSGPNDGLLRLTQTTTVKAMAVAEGKENSRVVEATYTKLEPLTTMDAIFAKATEVGETATNTHVTFNNWVISGVNSNNAYLTDGSKGLIIFKNGHGFEAGDILSGTVSCKIQLYKGSSELTDLTATSEGLTIVKGGELNPVTMTIDQITSGVYTGALITVENVLYNGTNLTDGTNQIKPYNMLYSEMSFINGRSYNVTGVYLLYDSTKEILPRSAADIQIIAATEYAITLNQSTGGTITASHETAAAGTEVTLSYTPVEGYAFSKWTVLDGEANEVTVTNNKFTMPESDVEVEATFNQIQTYTVLYSSNGIDTEVEGVSTIAELPTPENIPAGFNFAGWTLDENNIEFVTTPFNLADDMILYAVFSKNEGGSTIYEKVTENLSDWTGKYLLVYETGNIAWTGVDAGQCHKAVSISNGVISSKPDDAVLLDIAPMTGGYSIRIIGGDNNGKYIGRSTYSNGMNFDNEPLLNTLAIDNGTTVITASSGCTMRYNKASGTNNERFRYYKSGQEPVQLYKQNSGTLHYYTRVFGNETAEGNISIAGPSIIPAGATLNMGEHTLTSNDAANLIIENGAYLILKDNNNGVKATVKKNISGYGEGEGNYYLLGLPLAEIIYEAQDCGLTDPNRAYDLYRFDHTKELEWINHKEELFALSNGRGYLYASSTDTELAFAGTLNTTQSGRDYVYVQLFYEIGHPFTGFNLIGNPFACKAHVKGAAYVMNEDGTELEPVVSPTLMPCEGLFVQATDSDQYAKIYKGEAQAGKGMLTAIVSRNTHRGNTQVDRAIVSFDETKALPKFSLNANGSKLYIPQGDKHYAVVNSATEGSLPLCFKASKNGEYTLSFNTEGLEAEYLHLIDNMTGADTDLLATDSYSFSATTSDYASRFKLVFKTELQNNEANANASFAYLSDGDIVVSNEGRATLQLIDMTGRVLSTTSINGDCRINTSDMKAGLYILNLNGNTQKIVVK